MMKTTTKLSMVSAALAMAGVLAVSGPALADQVNARLDSVTPTSPVRVDVTALAGGGSIGTTEYAGLFNFTQNSGPLLTFGTNQFVSFCIDLSDAISSPSTHTWDVVDLAAAPDSTSGPMGAGKADALATLLGSNLGAFLNNAVTVLNDNTKKAAMQVAVWEVVFEDAGGAYDVSSGNAQFSNNNAVTAQAQLYLNNMSLGTKMGNLVGLTSTSTQDFVGQVPIPAAAWLFGSAMVGAVALGRRRKDKAAA